MRAPYTPGAAHADAAEGRIWVGLEPSDQLDQSIRRQAASSDEHLRRGRQQRNRLKVADEVERQRVGRSAEDMTIEMADAERVTVGFGAHYAPNSDGAPGAGDVFDDDRLTERDPHAFAQ